jgi:hypothetical protein
MPVVDVERRLLRRNSVVADSQSRLPTCGNLIDRRIVATPCRSPGRKECANVTRCTPRAAHPKYFWTKGATWFSFLS